MQRGRQAEQNAGHQREGESEDKYASIEMYFGEARKIGRHQCEQRAFGKHQDKHRGQTADERQQHALG